jgi:ribose 5-phosphate isomerase A
MSEIKKLLGFYAVDHNVESGMRIGLGTGSTAVWAVKRIAELLSEGKLSNLSLFATSSQTEAACDELGLSTYSLNDPRIAGVLDLTIDGADEIDPAGNLTKGGGGALLREKIAAFCSRRYVIVGDDSKLVQSLGVSFAIPIEVVPTARRVVLEAVRSMGAEVSVREAVRKMGSVITDNGNIIIDARFGTPHDPAELERRLDAIPGVVETGLFVGMRPVVYVGAGDGSIRELPLSE